MARLEIEPKNVFTKLLYLILVLLAGNIIGILSKFFFHHHNIYGLIRLFDFNLESNVPSLFSSFALLICSLLLAIIFVLNKTRSSSCLPWLGLSIIFLFLSIDEIASIHENFAVPIKQSLQASGYLYYSWVVPYGIALVVFVIIYSKFLMSLQKNLMFLFIISGVTYVTGAIGFELFGGRQAAFYGTNNFLYSVFYTCEEFFEMLGTVAFIYALLIYITNNFKYLTISIRDKQSDESIQKNIQKTK